MLISNKPYKLMYISTGNITNGQLLKIFSQNIEKIVEFMSKNRLIEITQDSIVIKRINIEKIIIQFTP